MSKLILAAFSRLWKCKEFLFSAGFMFLFAIYRVIDQAVSETGQIDGDGFFIIALFVGIIMAVFISLFVGMEHGSHTLRNKLIVGHKRIHVYLANYIVCTVAGWIFCACYFVPVVILGVLFCGGFQSDMTAVVLTGLCIFLLTAAYSAVFLLIAMLNSNRAVTAVVSILLALGGIVLGTKIQANLMEPEKIEMVEYTVNGEAEPVWEENPNYISNRYVRKFYETLKDLLPSGQAIQCSGVFGEIKIPSVQIFAYEFLIIFLVNGAGIAVFRRIDIK